MVSDSLFGKQCSTKLLNLNQFQCAGCIVQFCVWNNLIPLDEFQCRCCIMLILEFEVVVRGEQHSETNQKGRSLTQHLLLYAHHASLV